MSTNLITITAPAQAYLAELLKKQEANKNKAVTGEMPFLQRMMENRKVRMPSIIALVIFACAFPYIFSMYQTNIIKGFLHALSKLCARR